MPPYRRPSHDSSDCLREMLPHWHCCCCLKLPAFPERRELRWRTELTMGMVKLLIVEDDPLFGQALKEVVEGAGYRLRLTASGAEALEAIAEESFDLVVQDVNLPDANGLDVLQEIIS